MDNKDAGLAHKLNYALFIIHYSFFIVYCYVIIAPPYLNSTFFFFASWGISNMDLPISRACTSRPSSR